MTQKAKALIDSRLNELHEKEKGLRGKIEGDQKSLKDIQEEIRELENAKARL